MRVRTLCSPDKSAPTGGRWRLLGPLLVLLAWAAPNAAAQDVRVRASVSESTIGTEETVTYSLEVEGATFNDVETPRPPETEGLALVTPYASTQQSMTFINGQLRQSVAYRWTFRPIREGSARIAGTPVRVKNRTYTTDPITLRVVPQARRPQAQPSQRRGARPAPPPATADGDAASRRPTIGEQDLFVRVVPSKRRVVRNEQITLEYLLYFRDGIQLRHSRLAGSWDAEGFWREEFEVDTRPIPRVVVENGLRYNVITLKRVALFPTRTGSLRVDPLRIETEAFVPYRSADPFEQFFGLRNRFETVELASPPVTIEAVALPGNAPPGFDGAVGSYRMNARVSRTAVDVGEPVEIEIALTGAGNLATLQGPTLAPPGVFEQYDPQVDVTIDRTGRRIQGRKTFSYVVVPRTNGTFELPPATFTYFDPEAGRYETLRSDPATIRVTGTATTPLAATRTATGLPVDDIAGLLPATEWRPTGVRPLFRHPGVYGALAIPLLALGGLALVQRHRRRLAHDVSFARSRRAHPVARRHLKQADALLQKGQRMHRAFYEEIERAVMSFIGNRLNVAEQGLTRSQLEARLAAADVPADSLQALRTLLESCDMVRFSPVVPDRAQMEAAHETAARLIVDLDAALDRPAASVSPAPAP